MVYRECNYHLGYIIGCLGYIGDFTTQLCGDYFINHFTDPVMKQPGFDGKEGRVFFVAHLTKHIS